MKDKNQTVVGYIKITSAIVKMNKNVDIKFSAHVACLE